MNEVIKMSRKWCPVLLIGFTLWLVTSLFLAETETGKGPVVGQKGMVVSVDEYASRVGVEILKAGGNAVDAAVAVGFALAVTFPPAGNIGGGGFMIIRDPKTGECKAFDFREKAPGGASPDMYLDDKGEYAQDRSDFGHLAVGVPGTVKGFELAMKKYGSLEWKSVVAPAIALAENGFRLKKEMAVSFNGVRHVKEKASKEFLRIFTKPDDSQFVEGELFVQKELAESLKLIAEHGSDAFYQGKIADLIADDMEKHGGLITKNDLLEYDAVIRRPVKGTYRGYEIVSMPPPSSGGTILIEMLNILEGYKLAEMDRFAPETLRLMAETMKFAYFDRARYMGDQDFGEIPVDRLISKDYAKHIRKKIRAKTVIPSLEIGAEILTLEKGKETTHYSVIDKEGLAVSTTYTLNGGYGAFVVAEGTGILLNNEMADFNMKPGLTDDKGMVGTRPNLIEPYKRMLSSMTPTMVIKDGKAFLITGSPGGRTIINTVLNVLVNVIDFQMPVLDAVIASRMHHQWMPDCLYLEQEGLTDVLAKTLKTMGYDLKKRPQGDAHTILIDPKTGLYYGAADKRRMGSAIGY
jgi:gamma-glutamyltranspeptidase/glutathione hydrolase